ncbi:MAG: flagellar basal body-associated protein FliL [Methylocystis sp.]|uniref:flagellar basal body-associated protein FliL n=1 Tax=Methylocystis sp. TaxID=1911079 RepID=UPI003DA45C86
MNQTLIVGIWACVVTLAGAYGGVYFRQQSSASANVAHEEKLEARKIKPITVPIIADGMLRGYISAEFSLMTPKSDPHGHGPSLDPEGYVMDEAFRLIYSENKVDFSNMQKSDLAQLTSQITANVNKRLGSDLIRETLVKNFAFIPREELPK